MSAQCGVSAAVEFAHFSEARLWRGLLNAREKAAAEGMANEAVRTRFEISRGLRRKMLAEATGVAAEELTFMESAGDKPRVPNAAGWDFNVSHSGDHVAVAVGRGQVGIDLERIRSVREMESIVERYFHADETAAWRAMGPDRRVEAFFLLWSAREASMKCVGFGLARGLSVTRVGPEILAGGAASAEVQGMKLEVRRWGAPHGYVAMLAQTAV